MLDWLKSLFSAPPPETCMLVARSPHWPKLRAEWLREHPTCASCGSRVGVVPHHVVPVWRDRTSELAPSNLITLCPRDHILFGHLGVFTSWNSEVRQDAATWLAKIKDRP